MFLSTGLVHFCAFACCMVGNGPSHVATKQAGDLPCEGLHLASKLSLSCHAFVPQVHGEKAGWQVMALESSARLSARLSLPEGVPGSGHKPCFSVQKIYKLAICMPGIFSPAHQSQIISTMAQLFMPVLAAVSGNRLSPCWWSWGGGSWSRT